jgi:uncharacterized membrane protein YccC
MRVRSLVDTIKAHDPAGYALHRAVRVAVVVPATFAFTFEVIGNAQVATFTSFGGFALLLFADFPGSWTRRLTSYLMLSVAGFVLITLGTLAAQASWLAVGGMVVVGFAVLFAGTLSATIAAAGRAALLLFILPVTLPGGAADIAPRLAGWGIAVAVGIPVVMLAWPPREHNDLRRYAADTCLAVADLVDARQAGVGHRDDEMCTRVRESLAGLRRTFRGTAFRPVGLTTGSRMLIRLVDELEWLGSVVTGLEAEELPSWPDLAKGAAAGATRVLRASSAMLRAGRSRAGEYEELDRALAALAGQRRLVAAGARDFLDPATGQSAELAFQGRELTYAASLAGATVQWAADADARPVLDRILGRPPVHTSAAPLSPAIQIATSQLERHSVWLQNSIRGALGMGLAVLFVKLIGAQHAFWAVLGALSVLRSNALSTGSTVLRVLAGTVVGLVIGSALLLAVGTSQPLLWTLLPVAVLFAAFAPEAISFAAGQAGFTIALLVLFNIITPVGWKVGLIRIEDIGLGCAASLIVGVLVWPRGAAAAISTALSEAYRAGSAYLDRAVRYSVGRGTEPATELREMLAAGRRLDDALRQYLAERGPKNVPLAELTATANGAVRLRLAGEAISGMPVAPSDPQHPFAESTGLVTGQSAAVRDWYMAVADALDPRSTDRSGPGPQAADCIAEMLGALHRDLSAGALHDGDTEHAKQLLWTSLHLQDLRAFEPRLRAHLAAIPAPPAPLLRAVTARAAS